MTLTQIQSILAPYRNETIKLFVQNNENVTNPKFWIYGRLFPSLSPWYKDNIRTETEALIMKLLTEQTDYSYNIIMNYDTSPKDINAIVKRMTVPIHPSWVNRYIMFLEKNIADNIASNTLPNIRNYIINRRSYFVDFLKREFAIIPLSKLIDLLILRDEIDGKHNYSDDVSLRLQNDAWNEFSDAIRSGNWSDIDAKVIVLEKISEYLNPYILKFYAERTQGEIWDALKQYPEQIKERRKNTFWKTIIYRYFEYSQIPLDMTQKVEGWFIALTVKDDTKFDSLVNDTYDKKYTRIIHIAPNVFDVFDDELMEKLVLIHTDKDKDVQKTNSNVEDMFYRIVIEDLNFEHKSIALNWHDYLTQHPTFHLNPARLFKLTICGNELKVDWKFIGAYYSDLELLKKLPGHLNAVYGGYNIMCMVAVKGTLQVAQYLKDQGIAVTNKSLEVAIHYKNAELIEFLTKNGARYTGDLSSTSDAVIMAMVKFGGYYKPELIRILAEQNVNICSVKRSLGLFRTILDSGKYNAWEGIKPYYPLVRRAPDTRYTLYEYNIRFTLMKYSTNAENYFKLFAGRRPNTLRILALLSREKTNQKALPDEIYKLISQFLGNSPEDRPINAQVLD